MSDTGESATPRSAYDRELERMMRIGGITTEQPGELGVPVGTPDGTEPEADAK
ncbi:hypothetical protein ACFWUZ_33160 [Streptomyces sp. NPDC058646]|uniref:hypothetical protein n=1 Tax=Streptomyces sp. NPDC058646 TaxID=3346574 RepID=UPI00365C08B6